MEMTELGFESSFPWFATSPLPPILARPEFKIGLLQIDQQLVSICLGDSFRYDTEGTAVHIHVLSLFC